MDDLTLLLLPQLPPTKRTIVIIEPSLVLRTIFTETVYQSGYASVSYASPKAALRDLCQGRMAFPVLVLLSERQAGSDLSLSGWKILALFQQWALPLRTIFVLEEDR